MSALREMFNDNSKFLTGAELVTTRGIIQQENSRKITDFADSLIADKRVDWISVTDNAGGNPMLSPDYLGSRILAGGKQPIIHITCKDRNRNALESQAWTYASIGLQNLLVLSGDYPIDGFNGIAQPVFDVDSPGLLQLLTDMNNGMRIRGRKPNTYLNLDKTSFFLGCCVSPFKRSEAEQMMQYQKLMIKIKAGAHFVIPQLGYDIRKSFELLQYMKKNNLNVPLIGNIYRLTAGVARIFNKGLIPGCVVSDKLFEAIQKASESADKGKSFFISLAAKQAAAFRAMGCRGIYIGGIEKHEDFDAILTRAEEYRNTDWRDFVNELVFPRSGEFYFYPRSEIGLPENAESPQRSERYAEHTTLLYRFSRLLHAAVFAYRAPFFGVCRKIFHLLETKIKKLYSAEYFLERMSKAALFECRECGDCSLPDVTYLCPQSQCAKNQRNGPCGGSLDDKCEVAATGKYCIWVKAYSRTKHFKDSPLLDRPPVIKNNALNGTSGWANCFLLRDHNAYQFEASKLQPSKEIK